MLDHLVNMISIEGVGGEVMVTTAIIFLGVLSLSCYFDFAGKFLALLCANNELDVPARPYSNNTMCPICLCEATLTLETNCGHKFCGRCMIQYWRHLGPFGMSVISCAMCRQPVSMLFSVFSPEEERACDNSPIGIRRNHLLEEMHNYNRTFSTVPRTYWQMIIDSPVLVRHMLADLMSDNGIMRVFQLRIVCCIVGGFLYLLSPLDILPEALFGLIGFIDDLLVLLMLFVYLSTIYHRIMLNRAHDLSWMDSDAENEEEEQTNDEEDRLAEQAIHANLLQMANQEQQRLVAQEPFLDASQREEHAVRANLMQRVMREHMPDIDFEQNPLVGQDRLEEHDPLDPLKEQDSLVEEDTLVEQDDRE